MCSLCSLWLKKIALCLLPPALCTLLLSLFARKYSVLSVFEKENLSPVKCHEGRKALRRNYLLQSLLSPFWEKFSYWLIVIGYCHLPIANCPLRLSLFARKFSVLSVVKKDCPLPLASCQLPFAALQENLCALCG